MCLSGGFCKRVICSKSVVVQFGVGVWFSRWSHISRIGLMVVISAYNILGGWVMSVLVYVFCEMGVFSG